MKNIIKTLTLVFSASVVFAITIPVPGDYPIIQSGINAAMDGNTVLVTAGTYGEHINFFGKDIHVKSVSCPEQTTIDRSNNGCTVAKIS